MNTGHYTLFIESTAGPHIAFVNFGFCQLRHMREYHPMLRIQDGAGFQGFPEVRFGAWQCPRSLSLRVQVPNIHILIQNLDYSFYFPTPKDVIIGYLDPLGI